MFTANLPSSSDAPSSPSALEALLIVLVLHSALIFKMVEGVFIDYCKSNKLFH